MKNKTKLAGFARSRSRSRSASAPARVEALEPRILMSSGFCVMGIAADNRGQIVLTFNESVNQFTFNTSSVSVFTAGRDNLFNTSDDVRETIALSVEPTNRLQATITADLDPNTRYRVSLDSSIIRSLSGRALDGEFNGAGMPTGDGVDGGDLVFFTARAAQQVARFDTLAGVINVNLFNDRTPLSVRNFTNYSDSERYDGTIIHRSVVTPNPFVIQGGGFQNVPGFTRVTTDAPVRNEPGISNTRGTIAFAKFPNQPNSATSEWFFNLSDNTNLNTQNGGFTVFGEIADVAGLQVMDALTRYRVINASGVQGAFDTLPVNNDTVTGATLTTADTVLIRRVSILMDLSDAPAGQLDAPGFTVTSASGAFVTLFDMTGGTLGDLSNAFTVKFDGDRVSSIKINANAPAQGIGLAIGAARSVGSITDARTQGDLAFVVSSGPVGSINVKGSLVGADLGGLVVGSITLDPDIDGDGLTSDLLAAWLPEGAATAFRLRGGLSGDVIAMGGVKSFRVDGLTQNADINVGASQEFRPQADFTFGRMLDSSVRSETRIINFKATEWLDHSGASDELVAPSISYLKIVGDRRAGVAGDFEADLDLRGAGLPFTLGEMTIAGAFRNATGDVAGAARALTFKNGVSNVNFFITGDLRSVNAGPMSSFGLSVGGAVTTIRAAEWFGGELIADGVEKLMITGDRRFGADGDFAIRMELFGLGDFRPTFRSISIAGDVGISDWAVTGPGGGTVVIRGDVRDARMQFQQDLPVFRVGGAVTESDLNVSNGSIRELTVDSWRNGQIRAVDILTLKTTGDRRTGDAGDFTANVRVQFLRNMHVAGSVRDSLIASTSLVFDDKLRTLNVKGAIENSEFRIRGDVGTVMTAGMHNSQFYAAVRDGVSGLAPRFDTDIERSIDRFIINQPRDAEFGFVSSVIVTGELGYVQLGDVQPQNYGNAFGIAALTVQRLTYEADGVFSRFTTINDATTPQPFLDFQIRINYEPPADAPVA